MFAGTVGGMLDKTRATGRLCIRLFLTDDHGRPLTPSLIHLDMLIGIKFSEKWLTP